MRVHPRVCGEAVLTLDVDDPLVGPSPRVRGSPPAPPGPAPSRRSIPACAGKPAATHPRPRSTEVHPRVCGEASSSEGIQKPERGPSPRVRGSPDRGRGGDGRAGSIPACAGKPISAQPAVGLRRVHPRVCGEAGTGSSSPVSGGGPSPRVRGSRAGARDDCEPGGSIPACAGKPPLSQRASDTLRVHPRVCGEAVGKDDARSVVQGPSPRVRGSHAPLPGTLPVRGSIPACALGRHPKPAISGRLKTGHFR